MGIGDWQKKEDRKVRFKMASPNTSSNTTLDPDDIKGSVFRDKIFENFKIIDRSNDGIDQLNKDGDNDPTTHADDQDEMRLPGLINVNTAAFYHDIAVGNVYALQALNPYITNAIATPIQNGRPYVLVSNVLSSNTGALGGTTGLFLTGVTQATYDVVSPAIKWSRIANLITTRSDTFCAYIYVQALDRGGKVVGQRREMVLFDRSLCNQPPLRWNPGPDNIVGNGDDIGWEQNLDYRPVKIVARQRVD
jgi:hypothetical protein